MLRCLFATVLTGGLAASALNDYHAFYAQQSNNDYYAVQWQAEPASHPSAEFDGGLNTHEARPLPPPPHFPDHHHPEQANRTILTVLSESPEFSRLFKVTSISDEIVSLLNDSSTNLTFFALPNHAIPKPPHHHRRRGLKLDSVRHDLSLVDLISHVESIEVGSNELSARPSEEDIKKIVTAVLSYHIISDNLDLASLTKNTTYPTKLSHVFGALHDEALRLRFGPALPFVRINYYSEVVKPNIGAANGFIHAINRPLLPPHSVFQTTFLLQHKFATFSSALQRTGLTNAVDYKLVLESDAEPASTEGAPVVTAFAPSNEAFSKLPKKLQLFLFSPRGERALKKLLQYHIVPDVAVFTDWILNATSDAAAEQLDLGAILLDEEWLTFEADLESEHDFTEETFTMPPFGRHASPPPRHPPGHGACPRPLPCSGHATPWPPSSEGHGACLRSKPPRFGHPASHPGSHGAHSAPTPPACGHNAPHLPPPFAAHGACSLPLPHPFEHQALPHHYYAHEVYSPAPPFAHYGPPPSAYRYRPPSSHFGWYSPPPPQFGGYTAYSPSPFFQCGPPPPPHHGEQDPNFPVHSTSTALPGHECTAPPGIGNLHESMHRLPKNLHFPHPCRVPLPKPDLVANFTVATALEGHSLNVIVVKIPIKLPFPKHGEALGHVTKLIVNGQLVKAYDGVALNGVLHTVDRLISPRHGKGEPHRKPPMPHAEADNVAYVRQEESDDWEDWEDWLPAWAEDESSD